MISFGNLKQGAGCGGGVISLLTESTNGSLKNTHALLESRRVRRDLALPWSSLIPPPLDVLALRHVRQQCEVRLRNGRAQNADLFVAVRAELDGRPLFHRDRTIAGNMNEPCHYFR